MTERVVTPNLTTPRRIAITLMVAQARAFPSRMTVVTGVALAVAADDLLTELKRVEAALALSHEAHLAATRRVTEREDLLDKARLKIDRLRAALHELYVATAATESCTVRAHVGGTEPPP
ncbi:MAG: hypothetical protein Q8Q14_01845 [Gemmatimonadales bacterium]|nr:hypothetical protein [Gemmatimonadales bacterium]